MTARDAKDTKDTKDTKRQVGPFPSSLTANTESRRCQMTDRTQCAADCRTSQRAGLITYDAKDPDTKFPPIRDVRRADRAAPNVLVILIDDVGYGATSVFGGPCQTPNFEKLAQRRVELHALPYHGAVLADATGAAHRTQPSFGGHGRHHRDRDRRAGLQLGAAQHQGTAGADPQAQWLLDRAIRQMP